MDGFELVKLKKKALGEDCFCFECRNEVHKYRGGKGVKSLSLEDAEIRGIAERWQEDEVGGFVWERCIMSITKIPNKVFEIPRAGKRPKIVKETLYFLRCDVCKSSEKFILGSGEKELIKELLY